MHIPGAFSSGLSLHSAYQRKHGYMNIKFHKNLKNKIFAAFVNDSTLVILM